MMSVWRIVPKICKLPSRGVLRDYEPSDGTFWSTSEHAARHHITIGAMWDPGWALRCFSCVWCWCRVSLDTIISTGTLHNGTQGEMLYSTPTFTHRIHFRWLWTGEVSKDFYEIVIEYKYKKQSYQIISNCFRYIVLIIRKLKESLGKGV